MQYNFIALAVSADNIMSIKNFRYKIDGVNTICTYQLNKLIIIT